jgi:hypothetical protein
MNNEDVNEELESHDPVRWSEKLGRWITDDSEEVEIDDAGNTMSTRDISVEPAG